jgi:hypothetical protein
MDTAGKAVFAEKLHALMMESNDHDEYSAQNSVFGDLYNALKKVDVVDMDNTLNSGCVVYTKESGLSPCAS